jgi:hypothetical protein
VEDTLGTPSGNLPVDSDEEAGKAAFLELFGLCEVPSIRFFGKKILAKELLPDDVFCRCFMFVCLGTFFCPNSNTKLSTKYMGALVDVDRIKDRNWSKFIHEWLMWYLKKYSADPSKGKGLSPNSWWLHLPPRSKSFFLFFNLTNSIFYCPFTYFISVSS